MPAVRSPRRPRVAPRPVGRRGPGGLVAALAAPLALGAAAARAGAQAAPPPAAAQHDAAAAAGAGAAASLGGVVYDSLAGRPLAGALVQVVRAAATAGGVTSVTADSLGRYVVGGLAPGRYLVAFAHPALDALAVQVAPRAVDIVDAGAAGTLALATPGPARMRAALCPPAAAGDSSGALAGAVRDAATDAPAGDATVVLSWSELAVTRGGLRREPREVTAAVRRDGTFLVCGVPADGAVEAVARAPGRASGVVEVTVPARGLTVQRFALGPAAARPAASGSVTAAPRAPVGDARLAGRVVGPGGAPVRGARLRVSGTEARAETREGGAFSLAGLPAGTHTLEALAVGLQPTRVAVDLVAGRTTEVRVALPKAVPELERVVIKGTATRQSAMMTAFLARKRTGQGRYYTREDFDRIIAFDVTDVIRMSGTPAMQVVLVPRGRSGIMRAVLRGRLGCRPTVYVDGVAVSNGADEIDDVVRPSSVMAMEVYAGAATVPAMYNATGSAGSLQGGDFTKVSCGAVLVWTQH